MRGFIAGLACLFLGTSAATAQTPSVDQVSKALLENPQIRVFEMRLKPGARTSSENRPNTFVYSLTDGTLVFVPPGRTPYEMSFRAGEALWLPAQATALANEGDKEIRALVVEIKEKPAPVARPRKAAPQPAAAGPKAAKPKR